MNNEWPLKRYYRKTILVQYPLLAVILCFTLFSSSAQEYSYAHYDARDGLAGSVVYDMVQDHDGFMWFATETGLSRFDGTSFKNFTTEDGLPDNEIIKLFVDSKNRVWILPFKYAVCYYYRGKIHTPGNDSLLKKFPVTGAITSIAENGQGDIVFLESKQLIILKPGNEIKILKKVFDNNILGGGMLGINEQHDIQGLLLVAYTGGVSFILKDDRFQLSPVQYNFDLNKTETSFKSCMYPDLHLYTGKDSLRFYLPGKKEWYSIPTPEGLISVNKLNDSLVVFNSRASVETFNFLTRKKDRLFFTNKNISSVLEDREGNLWFASLDEGVYRLPSTAFKTQVFRLNEAVLPVFSLTKYRGNLVAGTSNFQVWFVDSRNNLVTHQPVFNGLNIGRIIKLDTMPGEGLIIGGDLGLVLKKTDNTVIQLIFDHSIKSLQVNSDTLWIGTDKYAFSVVKKNLPLLIGKRFTYYHLIEKHWDERITALFRQTHFLYAGTLNGLHRVGPGKEVFYMGELHPGLKNRIADIKGTGNNVLWIATSGSGLIRVENGQVTNVINEVKGLASNICRTLVVTDSTVWVGTDKGLNKVSYSGGNYSIIKFTMADGLIADIINAIYVDNNIVYVATPAGVTYFDETTAGTNSMCNLKITGIQSTRRTWSYDTSGIRFEHAENNIRFEFSGISFKSAGDITYQYRLLGVDDDWQTTRDNFLAYPTLPSGEYELQLKALNKFGVESETVTTRFIIEKLLWEKTGFRVTGLILFGLLVWIFITYRIRQIREQEALKAETNRKIAELEQMALKAQMNPHFIFNSLNSIQQYVIEKDIRGANKFITDFSRLVRLTLDLSSRNSISLQEEINYISTYLALEQAKFENRFTYTIQTGKGLDVNRAQVPPMILQPYIENSIRHGVRYRNDNQGRITVDFRANGQYIVCTIEDNGVGRKASARLKGKMIIEYQSKGMTLTAKRVDMINQNSKDPIEIEIKDLCNEEKTTQGTRVILKFPVKPAETAI